jgi:hypothetical protein
MDNGIPFFFFAFFTLIGGIAGYSMGQIEAKQAIEECQKELPRNVNCKVIAVPVDKN